MPQCTVYHLPTQISKAILYSYGAIYIYIYMYTEKDEPAKRQGWTRQCEC